MGLIKSLTEEVGCSLNNLDSELSHSCTGQHEACGGCVGHGGTHDLQSDNVVKIIVWAGRDKEGERVLKNYCLDDDKNNHTTKYSASTIKMPVKKPTIVGLGISSDQQR